MKVGFQTRVEIKTVTDIDKKIGILNEEHAMKKIELFLESLDQNLMQLKEEQTKITDASVIFAQFLKTNAITPYNDSMDAYLMHFINQEKDKVAQNRSDPKILQGMVQMRETYKEQMILLDNAMKDGDVNTTITPQKLEMTIQNLYKLQNSGHKLMEMMNKSSNYAKANYTEKRIEKNENFTTTMTTTRPYNKKSGLVAGMKKIGTKIFKDKEVGRDDSVKRKNDSIKLGMLPKQKSIIEDGSGNNSNGKWTSGKKQPPPLPPRFPKQVEQTKSKNFPDVQREHKSAWQPNFSGGHKSAWPPISGEQKLTLPLIVREGNKSTQQSPRVSEGQKYNPPPRPTPSVTVLEQMPISNQRAALFEQIRKPHPLKVKLK
jgi:hypothetical protein